MSTVVVIDGPGWCEPGLDVRGGRYPLAVESAVLRMVDRLVPGVSTLTRSARYFSLYWALADFAGRAGLDAAECKQLVRRAEVGLAWLSSKKANAHGADKVRSLVAHGATDTMADEGRSSYSPRPWGFWSQYGGPCITLGAVELEERALRPGRVPCPAGVTTLFEPLFSVCRQRPVAQGDLAELGNLGIDHGPDAVDTEPLRALLLGRVDDTESESGNAETRRAAFRILGRCAQLRSPGELTSWTDVLRQGIAYGDHLDTDPMLAAESRALAWRGTLFRHHTVGAWRRLWAELVDTVLEVSGGVTRDELHQWIRGQVGTSSVRRWLSTLPDTLDAHGNPLPAEEQVDDPTRPIESSVAVLLLGARRDTELPDIALDAFRGGNRHAKQFLDPQWIGYQRDEHLARTVGDLACALVDDMLAQAQRVALRKTRTDRSSGRLLMFTKLNQREGVYFASGAPEGRGNVGLRTEQLGGLATQLGLFEGGDGQPVKVTALGITELELA